MRAARRAHRGVRGFVSSRRWDRQGHLRRSTGRRRIRRMVFISACVVRSLGGGVCRGWRTRGPGRRCSGVGPARSAGRESSWGGGVRGRRRR
jgi:hypothetical protein